MPATGKVFLDQSSTTDAANESVRAVLLFCSAGLFVSLLLATYGLDLSPGFF